MKYATNKNQKKGKMKNKYFHNKTYECKSTYIYSHILYLKFITNLKIN